MTLLHLTVVQKSCEQNSDYVCVPSQNLGVVEEFPKV